MKKKLENGAHDKLGHGAHEKKYCKAPMKKKLVHRTHEKKLLYGAHEKVARGAHEENAEATMTTRCLFNYEFLFNIFI